VFKDPIHTLRLGSSVYKRIKVTSSGTIPFTASSAVNRKRLNEGADIPAGETNTDPPVFTPPIPKEDEIRAVVLLGITGESNIAKLFA
jgi:hypothetical protein